MKESKLIAMSNKVEAMGRVLQRIINELENLKTLTFGNHQVMKRLSEYEDIIKQLQEENGKEEKNTDGTTSGDSGSLITDE